MASDELASIFDAFDKESGEGRDYDLTVQLSDDYVDAHPEEFSELAELDIPQCVKALEIFRDAGFDKWKTIQVWLWHKFEPQNIGGEYRGKVRV